MELFCRQQKLPFSLIYWTSGYPGMQKRGFADYSTWLTSIMQLGYDYTAVDSRPDQIVIESWVGAPSQCLPETGRWTFTRSALDFVKKSSNSPPLSSHQQCPATKDRFSALTCIFVPPLGFAAASSPDG
jgi:hypothetical protein